MSGGYLLDTSVISALAPGKSALPAALVDRLFRDADRSYLPAIAVAEIVAGICKLRRMGGDERAERLSAWLEQLLLDYGEHVLGFDASVARVAGELSDVAVAAGRHPGLADVAIAAIAVRHDLAILTRNRRHFDALRLVVPVIDPFDPPPAGSA